MKLAVLLTLSTALAGNVPPPMHPQRSRSSVLDLSGGATSDKKVLVTGGVGYIGSHTVLELLQAGYEVVIADNLCNSNLECLRRVQELAGKKAIFHKVDIRDKEALSALFKEHDIGSVIHFAGLKAVGESVAKPLLYYQVNIEGTLNLVQCMADAGCFNIVFSSSATVYGDPASVPVTESFPTGATNPYGSSKLYNEGILSDVAAADGRWNVRAMHVRRRGCACVCVCACACMTEHPIHAAPAGVPPALLQPRGRPPVRAHRRGPQGYPQQPHALHPAGGRRQAAAPFCLWIGLSNR